MASNNEYISEALGLVERAQKEGVFLRILGSTGFRIHSPEYVAIHDAMDRPLTDIDFVAYGNQDREIDAFMMREKYSPMVAALTPELFASRRIYNHPSNGIHIDVFLDELSMCHKIPFRNRLEVDSPTIPLAELVLEKTQIVTLNKKDIKDMLILLAAHPIGDHDKDTINGKYIAELLAKDWGFYYTTKLNLEKIRDGLTVYTELFSEHDVNNIRTRLDQLSQLIEKEPKSLKWKSRAAIGPKLKWYNDVDDVERAEHLQDLK
ncbi:MAG: hypothetical protein GYA34_03255 [Chloroflexi bacterium]|nr:hypothetical protein [Chloroflexota bacterium]